MTDKEFENIIKKELSNIEATPSAGLFEKIMTARAVKTGGLSVAMKTTVLILSAVILCLSWIYTNDGFSKKNNELISISENNETQINENTNNETTLELNSISENNSQNSETSQKSISSTESTINTNNISENSTTNNSSEIANSNSLKKQNKDKRKTEKTSIKNSVESNIVKSEKSVATPFTKENSQNNLIENDPRATKNIAEYTLNIRKSFDAFLKYFSSRNLGIFELYSPTNNEELASKITQNIPKKVRPNNYLINSIELNAGSGIWFNSRMKYPENYSESSMYSFGANVKIRAKIKKDWNLIAGINYLQRVSDYDYNAVSKFEKMQIDTVIGFIQDPGAPPVQITKYDTSYLTITNSVNSKGKNIYRDISIPVGLEYFKQFDNSIIYGNLGLMFSLAKYTEGVWVKEGEIQPLAFSGKSLQTSSNISTGAFASLGYGYRLNHNLTLIAEAEYLTWDLQKNPLGQNAKSSWNKIGLNTGLRFKF